MAQSRPLAEQTPAERKCLCGTRSACPVHGRRAERTPDYDAEVEYLREARHSSMFQVCGGGRRVVRKKIGGD